LLLPLFHQHVVASVCLGARIFALDVFLEFLLVHDVLLSHDLVLVLVHLDI